MGYSNPDSLKVTAPSVPRVSYGLNAGAAFNRFGSVSYVEPRVQFRLTPRLHVFSSLTMLQTWGGPTFSTSANGEGTSTLMTAAPDRQYLLHMGGTYAMSERLLLTGSVWKDMSPSSMNRWQNNPFTYGRYPNQGFQFQAHYQVAPNVTVSGGVRYGNGANGSFGGYPATGFNSMWGY
ncbi:hypothetical protein DC20_12540 [Rufibacter tibetensis]|uniref:TonB-dependent receptor-like beta-barrel domain-containing protein n=1 Tax=Rufibacter tibetensis TaxID=512763 RepID=A0A0N7HX95_9BACT|nr:hypothetical protein DC20_12540 [Rufibacter tibetensis]